MANKTFSAIASVVELIGKFTDALLLSWMIGYLGISLTKQLDGLYVS